MSFASSYSKAPELTAALDAICDEVATGLNGTSPDLSFLFVSHAHAADFENLASLAFEKSGSRVLLGCTGETIVGGSEEIESGHFTSNSPKRRTASFATDSRPVWQPEQPMFGLSLSSVNLFQLSRTP